MDVKNIGNLIELVSETGYIHKIGTDTYFKKGMITDSVDNYEEVAEIPKYTKQEYAEKVRELIKEKYAIEDEIALYRQKDNKQEEFKEYYDYCEKCKIKAKEDLENKPLHNQQDNYE